MYITCLPEPPLPIVKAGKSWAHPDQQQVLRAQKLLNDAVVNNRQHYHLVQKVLIVKNNLCLYIIMKCDCLFLFMSLGQRV